MRSFIAPSFTKKNVSLQPDPAKELQHSCVTAPPGQWQSEELQGKGRRGFQPVEPRAGTAEPPAPPRSRCPRSTLGIVDFAADSQAGADSDSNKPFMKAAGKENQRLPVTSSQFLLDKFNTFGIPRQAVFLIGTCSVLALAQLNT